jgi:Protein of unknown function (DUF3892)
MAEKTAGEGAATEHGGIVDKARLEAALEALSGQPRPPEIGRKTALLTGKFSVHRYASRGDAVPPQTIVKGAGFPIRNASVWLVFWGSEWTQPNPPVDPNALIAAVKTIIVSDYVAYLQEYGVASVSWGGVYFDGTNPPGTFFRSTIQGEVVRLIGNNTLPPPNTGNFYDNFYCVMMPSTASYGPGGLSGEHSAATWTNPSDNHTYNPFVAWIGNGTLNAMTATFSHELAEALTDPQGTWIQLAPASASAWNEICDVCATVAYLDGVAVSSYWSNIEQACVIPENQFNSLFQYPPNGVALQVLAIEKAYSTEVGHEWIFAVRTRDNSTNIEYDLYRDQATSLIDSGANTMFVIGSDGSRSTVITRQTGDHKYLTTTADSSLADNLLSLPQFTGVV